MEVVDFIENQLNAMDFSIVINDYTVVGTETELYVCQTFHARKGSIITIDAVEYEVNTVVNNTTIIIEGLPATPTLGTLQTPNYFHGTAMAVNAELPSLAKDLKFPMLYCYEIIPEEFNNNVDSSIDREAELRLYFLDNADFQNWTTDEHYNYVINGMKNFQQHMIAKFNDCPKIADFDNYRIINHVKFGVWTERGHTNRVFNENLSGVELLVTLPLKKLFCDPNSAC